MLRSVLEEERRSGSTCHYLSLDGVSSQWAMWAGNMYGCVIFHVFFVSGSTPFRRLNLDGIWGDL
jgi:hypothetical protein